MNNANNTGSFHERDSSMDIKLQRDHSCGDTDSAAGRCSICPVPRLPHLHLSGGRKQRIQEEKITIAEVAESHFLDYVDAEESCSPFSPSC